MRNKILVRIDDYIKYQQKHNTNKLDDNNIIYSHGGRPNFIKVNEELFEGRECDYEIIKDDGDIILIKFKSTSNTSYRIDLMKEPNSDIWHIGFSLYENDISDSKYELETDKNESIDVLSRIVWILKDLNRNVEYCIGSTGNEFKDNIYKYMMRFVSNWEKRDTKEYKSGWAIYFRL